MRTSRSFSFGMRRLAVFAVASIAVASVGTGVAVAVRGGHAATPPAGPPPTASLPDGSAADPGPCGPASSGTRTCALTAAAGTVAVPAGSLPVWGFSTPASGAPSLPGPTLIAVEGETIVLSLHSSLPAAAGNVALTIPGAVTSHPDAAGVATGGNATYTFSSPCPSPQTTPVTTDCLNPGTYVYEAAQLDGGPRQVAMGLAGLLIVRPKDFSNSDVAHRHALVGAPASACSNVGASGFDAEATVIVNEIDPALNNDPINHGTSPYEPKWFFVNGTAFDPSAPASIDVAAGDCALLHFADLGLQEHSMGIIGQHETVLARDGRKEADPPSVSAEYLTPGQTSDAATLIPTTAQAGDQLPLVDLGRHLHNQGATGLGGAAILLRVVSSHSVPNPVGPSVVVHVAPMTNDGTFDLAVTGTFGAGTASAQWWFDKVSGPGTVVASAHAGSFSFTIPAASIPTTGFFNGDHLVWVQATDGTNVGAPGADAFHLDRAGPPVSALAADPRVTNGSTPNKQPGPPDANGLPTRDPDVLVTGTAEPALADWQISDATLCLTNAGVANPPAAPASCVIPPIDQPFAFSDTTPGSPVALQLRLSSTLLTALAEGTYHAYVRATETLLDSSVNPPTVKKSRPGLWVSTDLVIDKTGPTSTITDVSPNPAGLEATTSADLNYFPSIRLKATVTDTASKIADTELFVTHPSEPAPGTVTSRWTYGKGTQLTVDGATFGSAQTLKLFQDIPSAELTSFAQGAKQVVLWVHGQDEAGTWGPLTRFDLDLDRTAPVVAASPAAPTVSGGTSTDGTLDFYAQDPTNGAHDPASWQPFSSGVVAIEWQISYANVIDNPNPNLFTTNVGPSVYSGHGLGDVVHVTMHFSGGPTPYPPGARILFRVRDAAGNFSSYYQATIH